jgi:hypothetical protein
MATQICRHIRSNGSRCGCIALSGQTFCYYHDRTGKLHRSIIPPPPLDAVEAALHRKMLLDPSMGIYSGGGPLVLDFPPLEDRESIQIALSMVVAAIAQSRIDTKRAALLIYGLQVASGNARNLDLQPSRDSIVTETVFDEDGRQIAPDEDPKSEIALQKSILSPENKFEGEELQLVHNGPYQ